VLTLVASFVQIVQPWSWAMRSSVFTSFLTVLTGWVFAPRRTITGMLVAAGVAGQRHHAAFHRIFSRSRWALDELGLILFGLVRELLPPATVQMSLDDTLARKRGLRVFGAGMYRDPLLSSRKLAVATWGHSWVILAVIVRLPFSSERVFSLPILFRLYLNESAALRWRRAYRTRPQLAQELLHRLCGAHPERHFHVTADMAYGGQSILRHLPANCGLTSRLPMDARLYDAPTVPAPRRRGRPRKRGARLPTPQQMLHSRARRATLDIYGRTQKVRLVETVARWHCMPERPVKVVVIEPLTGGHKLQAFYSTNVEQTGEQLLVGYSERWSIEEAIQGGKSHLGFEEPQGWSRLAVLRTAPIALLLYSLIVVWFARVGHTLYRPLVRPWYLGKVRPSFADMLRTLRRESLLATISAQVGSIDLPRNVLSTLLGAANAAA
jgi:hypothetical protein